MFEDIATIWRVIGSASRVSVIPDVLFHCLLRQSSIANDHSITSLVDCWTARIERYHALASRSSKYRHALVEQCVWAIGRTWCWCIESSKDELARHTEELDEMSSFARQHVGEVLRGNYPIYTKTLCVIGSWRSPLAWRAIHATNSLRRTLSRQRMYD